MLFRSLQVLAKTNQNFGRGYRFPYRKVHILLQSQDATTCSMYLDITMEIFHCRRQFHFQRTKNMFVFANSRDLHNILLLRQYIPVQKDHRNAIVLNCLEHKRGYLMTLLLNCMLLKFCIQTIYDMFSQANVGLSIENK